LDKPVNGGHKYRDLNFHGGGMEANLTTVIGEGILLAKSKELKTRCNLIEYSEEGYGSKRMFYQ
jgi:hypothetical protein